MENKRGLTLIELLAVIAIIAILFVLLIPQISSAIEKSRENGILMDFRSYQQAGVSYLSETKKGERTVKGFNKHLDKALKFEQSNNILSNKEHVFGEKYYIALEAEERIRIYTLKNRETQKEKMYELYIAEKEGEITSWSLGLSKNINTSDVKVDGDFEYVVLHGKEIEIVNYIGSSKNVTIPNTIEEKPVTSIGGSMDNENKSFRKKGIDTVTIPSTVKYIGYQAFRFNNLTQVNLPSDLEILGESSFRENKLTSINIPSKVKTIMHGAFYGNFITSVNMGDEVTEIGRTAFYMNRITTLRLSEKLKTIDNQAFYGNQIRAVTIPNTVEKIGVSAFRSNELATVTIPNKVTEIGEQAFASNGTMINYRILGNPIIGPNAFPGGAQRQ